MRQRFILAPARPVLTAPVPRRGFMARVLALAGAGALLGRTTRAAEAPRRATSGWAFVGEIAIVGFDFAPMGWALCNGQLLPISEYAALYGLIGTTYGGDGVESFALPNLNGRAANHQGQGPGLPNHVLGEQAGTEIVTLTSNHLPVHSHAVRADSEVGTSDAPAGKYPVKNSAGVPSYGNDPGGLLGDEAIGLTGNNTPHDNMQPYLTLNFIIALYGMDPPRN